MSEAPARTPAITSRFAPTPRAYQGHLAVFRLVTTCNGGALDTTEVSLTVGTRSSDDPVGPDRYGYYAFDNTDTSYPDAPVYSWIEIDPNLGGSGTQVSLGDYGDYQDKSTAMNLPFTFRFYGEPFTRATICSNGWIAMGDTYLTDYRNWYLPGAGCPQQPDRRVLGRPPGGQLPGGPRLPEVRRRQPSLDRRSGAGCTTSPAGTATFQAILLDPAYHQTASGDGIIIFQYSSVANTDGTDGYATVGIQNFDHTDAITYTYFNNYPAGAATLVAGARHQVPAHQRPADRRHPGDGPQRLPQPRSAAGRRGEPARHDAGPTPAARTAPIGGTAPAGDLHGRLHPRRPRARLGSRRHHHGRPGHDPGLPPRRRRWAGHHRRDRARLHDRHRGAVRGRGHGGRPQRPRPGLAGLPRGAGGWVERADGAERRHLERGDPGPARRHSGRLLRPGPGRAGTRLHGPGRGARLPSTPSMSPSSLYTTDCEGAGDPAWQIGVTGDYATTGIWIRDDPVGTWYGTQPIQPEDDHTRIQV